MSAERIQFLLRSIVILCLATAFLWGQPKSRFVSPRGNDSHSGLSIDQPLRSINSAIKKAVAGDTIYILPGTYKELISLADKKGRPEVPICLMGLSLSDEEFPIIDGGAVEPSSNATYDWIDIKDSQWIEIAGLTFRNGWTFPIKVAGSSYLTFRKCQFWGGKRVINATGPTTHHILVEDCFWDQGGDYLWRIEHDKDGVAAWTSMHHGAMAYFNGSLIDFHGTGGSMVIRRNTVVNAFQAVRYRGEKGYDSNVEIYDNHVSNMRDNDFEPEYYTYNLHVYHNVSHNIHRTLSVDNVEGGQIYYYGNVVTADADPWSVNICAGLWKVYGRERRLSYPIYAFNNSFYSSGTAFHSEDNPTTLLTHVNNAYSYFLNGGWKLSLWDTSEVFDYDISNRSWPSNITMNHQEAHGRIADVKFVDPVHGDMRLQPGSVGIDAGKVMTLNEFDWVQSYDGRSPDVGAYEGDKLVEGPPFRFLVPPEVEAGYKEKPRIVRDRIQGNKVFLYFSERIDPSSVQKDAIALFKGGKKLIVTAISFPRNRYELVIETNADSVPGELSLSFKHLPTGMNGEKVTYWASTARIHKSGVTPSRK